MRISDWSSDVCSSDLNTISSTPARNFPPINCALPTGEVNSSSRVPMRLSSAKKRIVRAGTRKINTQGATEKRLSRSEEHTSELQSLMRISYAVFCLKKKDKKRMEYKTST